MARELSGRAYGRWLTWHVAAVIAVTFGLPVVIHAVACVWSRDFSMPDEAEVVETLRLTTGTGVAVFAYILAVVVFVWPNWRRMKTLKLPASASLIVAALFLIETPFFLSLDEAAIFGWSASSFSGYPMFLLSALSVTVAMVLAHPPLQNENAFRRFGYSGAAVVAAIVIILVGFALLIGAMKGIDLIEARVKNEQDFSGTLLQFIVSMSWFFWLWPFASLALIISLARCVIISRRKPAGLCNGNASCPTGMPSNT